MLGRIISLFFCTSVTKGTHDRRSFQKVIFVVDITGKEDQIETFAQEKNFQ
jgi:hypothetical protein